jgi:hypothetical protein
MVALEMQSHRALRIDDRPGDRYVGTPSGRLVASLQLEPPVETEPVTATVDHADIRGLVTTLLVSVAAPASL